MNQEIIALTMLVKTAMPLAGSEEPLISPIPERPVVEQEILVEKTLELEKRHPNQGVSEAFGDNILLALHYFKGDADSLKKTQGKIGPQNISWEKVREPFEASIVLEPEEVFAFHENIREEYKVKPREIGKSHFSYDDGYKAVAGLYGNGVCHLASLINWTASEAGLEVTSPVNHDFYPIPEVPREYGTSILYWPNGGRNSQNQNLYLKNNLKTSVKLVFRVDEGKIDLRIEKIT